MSGRKTETTEKELTPIAGTLPKRGRPKRTETAAAESVKPEGKKRGRKPASVKTEETKSAKGNASAEKTSEAGTSEASAVPKKRGRPRKNPDAVEKKAAETNIDNAEASKEAQPKKNRKPSAKKQEATVGDISSKTPQVMRLVQQGNDMVNPTIMAGKSSIPRKLRGLEPLTKIMKREAEEIFGTDQEDETFNLTALVIDDSAAEILRRFNACDCEICVEQLSRLTADIVPARFAKLKRRAVERNTPEVEELKAPLRRSVTSQMIRLVIQNKKRSYHD